MPPTIPRDFLKASKQRLATAEQVFNILHITLDAQYIEGYTVECALKALILEKTPENDRPKLLHKLTHGAKSNRPEVLLGWLKDLEISLTPQLAKRMRRFDWTTALRYETGRLDTGETRALLKTASEIYDWVEKQIS